MAVTSFWAWSATWAVVVVGVAVGLWFFGRAPRGRQTQTAEPSTRRQTYQELAAETGLTNFDTGSLLLQMAVDLYDRKKAAYDVLDDKAQKLLGLIGAGASLYTLLGGLTGGLSAQFGPLFVLSGACFFGSLLLLLISLSPRENDIPALTRFNSQPVLNDPDMRARLARRFIEAWQELTYELTPILRTKGRYIFAASCLLVSGITLLLLNFAISFAGSRGSDQPASCTIALSSGHLVIDCKGKSS